MTTPDRDGHYVKRVVLPSGKTIDVVYFKNAPAPAPRVPAGANVEGLERPQVVPARDRQLHVCPDCESELVYPIEWGEADEECWDVVLRCPNCEWCDAGVYRQDEVEWLDEQLDKGTEALVSDYKRLMRANMAEEIERFVAALEADAILPMDF